MPPYQRKFHEVLTEALSSLIYSNICYGLCEGDETQA